MEDLKQIQNYDDLLEEMQNVDVKQLKKVLDSVDDSVIKSIYNEDNWIIEESQVVTGSLSSIAKERIRQLLIRDLKAS